MSDVRHSTRWYFYPGTWVISTVFLTYDHKNKDSLRSEMYAFLLQNSPSRCLTNGPPTISAHNFNYLSSYFYTGTFCVAVFNLHRWPLSHSPHYTHRSRLSNGHILRRCKRPLSRGHWQLLRKCPGAKAPETFDNRAALSAIQRVGEGRLPTKKESVSPPQLINTMIITILCKHTI